MITTRRFLLSAAVAACLSILSPTLAFAQPNAGSKMLGQHSVPFWSSRSSAQRMTVARDYAQDFQRYVAANPKPDPAVVREVTTEIGKNLDDAKAHLAQLKKDFAANKEALAGIASIEKQLTAAFDHHKQLCECCENETFDKIATMKCCTDLTDHLDKILTEHDALMIKLSPPKAAVARKPN